MVDINDGTSITIPIRNLIALIAGTAVAVTGFRYETGSFTGPEPDSTVRADAQEARDCR